MNFQAIEEANGQQIQMFGTFIEVGGAQFTQNQKAKAVCKIRDVVGVTHKVHIYQGTGQLPTPQNLNQRCQFTLSAFQGNYQGSPYTGYSGFWNNNAQVNQNISQQGQQAPQQPAQTTNYQPPAPQGKKEPDWDAISRGKVRHGILCAMLQGGIEVDYEEVLRHTEFVMSGVDLNGVPDPHPSIQENPGYVGDNRPQPIDDDIPF